MSAEKKAWFILFVIGRLLRNPSWVITQWPPTPDRENGDWRGVILYSRVRSLTVWKEHALSQYEGVDE